MAKDGERLPVGTNLLISGSLSAGLVSERVLGGLAEHQNNFISHLRDWTLSAEIEMAKSPNMRKFDPVAMLEEGTSTALFNLHSDARMSGLIDPYLCTALIAPPKGQGKRDLHDRPMIFITAAKPTELTRHLELSHLGHPFIHVGLRDIAACSRFEEVCTAVIDGYMTVGTMAETVRGFVIATDQIDTLANVIRASDGKGASWLTRMLWLTDSAAGPGPGNITAGKATVKLDAIQARFDAAMDKAWVERLDFCNAVPKNVKYEWPQLQAKWVAFLKRMETELPGITGAARSLLATLVFGLTKLACISKPPDGFPWHAADIAALARWLIRRMANARAAMLHTEHQARIRSVAHRIVLKDTGAPAWRIRHRINSGAQSHY